MTRVAADFHELAEQAGYRLVREPKVSWLSPHGHLNPVVQAGIPRPVLAVLERIFNRLEGDEHALAAKKRGRVGPDFLWPQRALTIEVDEVQHFTRYRAWVLAEYRCGTPLPEVLSDYPRLCDVHQVAAERAYSHVVVAEFPAPHSRARQRAYFDALRDLCAPYFTEGAVLRLPALERDAQLVLKRFRALERHRAACSRRT